jgi:ATP adenylyltransferase
MRYVQGDRKDEGCIFCLAAASGNDEARLVLHRGERCLVILNAFPYNSGHLMVSPTATHRRSRISTAASCSSS